MSEPGKVERLKAEMELLGFTVTGHALELYPEIQWDKFCPVAEVGKHVGKMVTVCGMIVADRVFQQATGEPMKFLTICDYSGMMATELFAQQYRLFGLQTVRHPVLRITGKVVPYTNRRGRALDVVRVEPAASP